MGSKNISHAEMWDDSLLVESWNDALEEYKHYHSLHARGEKVQDVLKMAEKEVNGIGEQADYEDEELHEQNADLHAKADVHKEVVDLATSTGNRPAAETIEKPISNQTPGGPQSKGLALPQHLIGQVHDERLKNLLMSWYYAGYYTGLYEGQQQGVASKDA